MAENRFSPEYYFLLLYSKTRFSVPFFLNQILYLIYIITANLVNVVLGSSVCMCAASVTTDANRVFGVIGKGKKYTFLCRQMLKRV